MKTPLLHPIPSAARWPLWVYRSLFPVAFVGMLPSFVLRMMRRGNYRHKFGQRFGIYSQRARAALEPGGWTWIHAVSVGEMMMGLKLARQLQAAQPGARVLLSTTTSTGYALARTEVQRMRAELDRRDKGQGQSTIELIYYPLDLAMIVRRVLAMVRPCQLILVDKEFWPNMMTECYRRGIPVSIVNARLSARSERRFHQWRRWCGPFFGMLKQVCVQEPEDAARWVNIGVQPDVVHCTGSLKFDFAGGDSTPSRVEEFRALLAPWGGRRSVQGEGPGAVPATPDSSSGTIFPILLGGSTFPGEEKALAEAFITLRPRFPDLLLILVPRHVERTPEIEATLKELGLTYRLRSELQAGSPPSTFPSPSAEHPADVLLVNTTGELRDWYAVASVCFVGKSLTTKLGQNPAEPILAGRPVVFGPHMQNFKSLVEQFLAVDGANQVPDKAALVKVLEELLLNPEKGAAQVARARIVLHRHEGAYQRTLALLLS